MKGGGSSNVFMLFFCETGAQPYRHIIEENLFLTFTQARNELGFDVAWKSQCYLQNIL